MTLRRDTLRFDAAKGIFRIIAKRGKPGVDVSIPIPKEVGDGMLALQNSNPDYFFWNGNGKPQSATSNWGRRYIAPCFNWSGARHFTGNAVLPVQRPSSSCGRSSDFRGNRCFGTCAIGLPMLCGGSIDVAGTWWMRCFRWPSSPSNAPVFLVPEED
jgi:hypothetical protein